MKNARIRRRISAVALKALITVLPVLWLQDAAVLADCFVLPGGAGRVYALSLAEGVYL